MKINKKKKKDIAQEFALATKLKNIETLSSLLSDEGIFELEDNTYSIKEADKQQFVEWYKGLLDTTTISEITYDKCLLCLFGSNVIIFNNGKFPRTIQDDSERIKTGLALNIKKSMIVRIKFCFSFLHTENKFVFQCRGEKIKEFIAQGLTTEKAIQMALKIPINDLD